MKRLWMLAAVVVAFSAGFLVRGAWPGETAVHAQGAGRIFELRTYTAVDAEKLTALHARFKNHTLKLFEKHGMQNGMYWVPTDEKLRENTLIYVVSHESQEAADKSWKAFQADPDWIAARNASEKDGKIVERLEKVFMTATEFSPKK